jgi:cytoskeletal protein RodZ
MATKRNKKKPAKKRPRKKGKQKRSLPVMLRQWSLPLFLLLVMSFSLAAAFYLIFLHIPAAPLF